KLLLGLNAGEAPALPVSTRLIWSVALFTSPHVRYRHSSASPLQRASPSSYLPAWSSPARHVPLRSRLRTAAPSRPGSRKSILKQTSRHLQCDRISPDRRASRPGTVHHPYNKLRPSHSRLPSWHSSA